MKTFGSPATLDIRCYTAAARVDADFQKAFFQKCVSNLDLVSLVPGPGPVAKNLAVGVGQGAGSLNWIGCSAQVDLDLLYVRALFYTPAAFLAQQSSAN